MNDEDKRLNVALLEKVIYHPNISLLKNILSINHKSKNLIVNSIEKYIRVISEPSLVLKLMNLLNICILVLKIQVLLSVIIYI